MTIRELWAVMAMRARAKRQVRDQRARAELWKHRAKVEATRANQLELEASKLRKRVRRLEGELRAR